MTTDDDVVLILNVRSKIKIFSSYKKKLWNLQISMLTPKLGQIAIYTMILTVLEGYPLQTMKPTFSHQEDINCLIFHVHTCRHLNLDSDTNAIISNTTLRMLLGYNSLSVKMVNALN
jgi:hypothetical protein